MSSNRAAVQLNRWFSVRWAFHSVICIYHEQDHYLHVGVHLLVSSDRKVMFSPQSTQLFVCEQEYTKTTHQIHTKICGRLWNRPRKNWLKFGPHVDKGADQGIIQHFIRHCEIWWVFIDIFTDFPRNNSWISIKLTVNILRELRSLTVCNLEFQDSWALVEV